MLIPYLAFGLVIGLFMSFIWSSKGGANCLIKTGWVLWTLWTIVMLAVTVFPELAVAKAWS
jgi:preprotein translocase subunit SecG